MTQSSSPSAQPPSFQGRVIIVTGAGRGMGREHALYLAAHGARVVVNDTGVSSFQGGDDDQGPAHSVVNEIIAAGGEAVASLDTVATPEGARAIIDTAMAAWGRVDGLLHNAGIAVYAEIEELKLEDYRRVVGVNIDGALFLTQAVLPIMKRQNFGRIVYVTSGGGLLGVPGMAAYAIAKTGMMGLMNVVRAERGTQDIYANMLGVAAYTRMTAGAFGEGDAAKETEAWWAEFMAADKVAPAAAWLLHSDCKANGVISSTAGGHVSRMFLGETRGFTKLDLTFDDVRENQAVINDETHYRTPTSSHDYTEAITADLVAAGAKPLLSASAPVARR